MQAVRTVGRECIERRLRAIQNGSDVPSDILSQILGIAGKFVHQFSRHNIPSQKEK